MTAERFDLIIIGCGKSKRQHASPAADLYTGQLFRAARQYAEAHADAYLIASARHGLVEPTAILEPYDDTLPAGFDERRAWGFCCQADLAAWLNDRPHLMHHNARGLRAIVPEFRCAILAGRRYAEAILDWTALGPHNTTTPLAGLGIGHRLQYLAGTTPATTTEPADLPLFAGLTM